MVLDIAIRRGFLQNDVPPDQGTQHLSGKCHDAAPTLVPVLVLIGHDGFAEFAKTKRARDNNHNINNIYISPPTVSGRKLGMTIQTRVNEKTCRAPHSAYYHDRELRQRTYGGTANLAGTPSSLPVQRMLGGIPTKVYRGGRSPATEGITRQQGVQIDGLIPKV